MGRAMGGYIDPAVTWKDLSWIHSQLHPPSTPYTIPPSHVSFSSPTSPAPSPPPISIGLKGIQSTSDVLLALHHGARIIWLSNHGGRGLDTSPPALYILAELRRDHPWVFKIPGVEFWIDGGVRRGTDIVKALCLGARGVGIGRSFMYALMYGTEGIRHAIQSK